MLFTVFEHFNIRNYSNIDTVYLKRQLWDECVNQCKLGIKVGTINGASTGDISKIQERSREAQQGIRYNIKEEQIQSNIPALPTSVKNSTLRNEEKAV